MPQQRERGRGDEGKIAEQGQRCGCVGLYQQRHEISPDEPECRDQRSVPQRHDHGGRGCPGEEGERQPSRKQFVELICRVEAGEYRRRTGGGKGLRYVGGSGLLEPGRRFAPRHPVAGECQADPEQHAEHDAHRRGQETVVDRQLDQKTAAESERQPAEPHQPVLGQYLLPPAAEARGQRNDLRHRRRQRQLNRNGAARVRRRGRGCRFPRWRGGL